MPRSARRPVLLVGGAVLASAAVVTAFQLVGPDDAPTTPTASTSTSAAPAATSSASPTSAGVAVTSVPAPGPGQEVATDPESPRTGGAVDPLITYAGWEAGSDSLEVNGQVSGVVEMAGTCRVALTQGATTLVAENPAEPDATTMNCGLLQFAGADLGAGTWTAVLTYESATSEGESPAVDVEVPVR